VLILSDVLDDFFHAVILHAPTPMKRVWRIEPTRSKAIDEAVPSYKPIGKLENSLLLAFSH
jgi:hypothetical protein